MNYHLNGFGFNYFLKSDKIESMSKNGETDGLSNARMFGLGNRKSIKIPGSDAISGGRKRIAEREVVIIIEILLPTIDQSGFVEDFEEFHDGIICRRTLWRGRGRGGRCYDWQRQAIVGISGS